MISLLLGAVLLSNEPSYETNHVEGWKVHVSTELLQEHPRETSLALDLIAEQLKTIRKVVPAPAVKKLTTVSLWLSPAYEGFAQTAEYHPSAEWLVQNGRSASMAKGIEFTNILNFEAESRRMPSLVLHELAHAFHDQFIEGGFGNLAIQRAYEQAKLFGWYEDVQRRDASGKVSIESAYALTNAKEYFAELTEAYFGINDFFPFTQADLAKHDPGGYGLMRSHWGLDTVSSPPAWMNLDPFYEKYYDAGGYPVVSSARVNDYALKETAYLINLLLARRPDIKRAMVQSGSRMIVMAWNEFTSDIPEYKWLEPAEFWDRRARGLGGSRTDPVCSCAEENVLGYPGDPYSTESIVIHEFAHNIHLRGLVNLDPTFDDRLKSVYQDAMSKGLWKGKYAATNHHEYFAEGVQSWFDNNREPDNDHNHVNTRAELLDYDPGLAEICREVFGETELTYTKPVTRLHDHLLGYDPSKAPTFKWREKLGIG
ncbi:hypothetical protein QPK87_17970 [Kamptonema cortianum]|nr:hypothetical protein [Geitlerinema splendidum]MDK3158443.1 hypothetical protein [Kamptonema cortianum]